MLAPRPPFSQEFDMAAAAVPPAVPPATPMMAGVGLDWSGVRTFAERSIRLVRDHGPEFLDMIEAGFKAFKAITGRGFVGIFAAINDVNRDLNAIIAAIKDEFGI